MFDPIRRLVPQSALPIISDIGKAAVTRFDEVAIPGGEMSFLGNGDFEVVRFEFAEGDYLEIRSWDWRAPDVSSGVLNESKVAALKAALKAK